jgi:hypothetical protein
VIGLVIGFATRGDVDDGGATEAISGCGDPSDDQTGSSDEVKLMALVRIQVVSEPDELAAETVGQSLAIEPPTTTTS